MIKYEMILICILVYFFSTTPELINMATKTKYIILSSVFIGAVLGYIATGLILESTLRDVNITLEKIELAIEENKSIVKLIAMEKPLTDNKSSVTMDITKKQKEIKENE